MIERNSRPSAGLGESMLRRTMQLALVAAQTLVYVPRKVWLGRPRGNNEPHVPSRVFTGKIADDTAVRAWVLSAMDSKAAP